MPTINPPYRLSVLENIVNVWSEPPRGVTVASNSYQGNEHVNAISINLDGSVVGLCSTVNFYDQTDVDGSLVGMPALDATLDSKGNIIVGCYTANNNDRGVGSFNVLNVYGPEGGPPFISALHAQGTAAYCGGVGVDKNDNIYASWASSTSGEFSTNFLVKLGPNGEQIWSHTLPSNRNIAFTPVGVSSNGFIAANYPLGDDSNKIGTVVFRTDGTLAWSNSTMYSISRSRARLFVFSDLSTVFVIEAATGRILWSILLGNGTSDLAQYAGVAKDSSIFVGVIRNGFTIDIYKYSSVGERLFSISINCDETGNGVGTFYGLTISGDNFVVGYNYAVNRPRTEDDIDIKFIGIATAFNCMTGGEVWTVSLGQPYEIEGTFGGQNLLNSVG